MFAGLMVTSLSLALGLVIGDAIVVTIGRLAGYKQEEEELLLEEQPEEDKLEKNGKVAEDELVEVEVLKGDGEWQVDEW
eukprot:4621253-Amphidinium_carterae.1